MTIFAAWGTTYVMYKIIGADQKEYGPITAEQMQQWILEGRINSQTLVWSEESGNWKPLFTYPELAAKLPAGAPQGVPPASASAAGGRRDIALEKVNGPSIGLMVVAIVGFLTILATVLLSFLDIAITSSGIGQSGDAEGVLQLMSGTVGIIRSVIGILCCIVVFSGALQMRKLRSYGLAMVASIIALVPCFSPCCLIGIPIGIWALVVLNKPEVKPYFE